MEKKQLLALFVCSLVLWTVGNGLVLPDSAAGFAFQSLGKNHAIVIGIGLLLLAAILLIPVRAGVKDQAAVAGSGVGAG